MTKKLYLLMIIFLAYNQILQAKDDMKATVKGIISNNKKPLPYISVYAKGTIYGASTDLSGNFSLQLPAGKQIIVVSGIGYASREFDFELSANETMQLDVSLETETQTFEHITVTGNRIGLLRHLPGSATVLNKDDLHLSLPVSNNEAFRQIPGLHAVEEEGIGLRANIGIRGLDPDRSRTVLVLEDGIPVALGPYGEPELYYTPAMDRMQGVEVLKGSGQILFGPQTIGGVINYQTADAPSESKGLVSLRGGMGGSFSGLLSYGNTSGNTGYSLTYLHKQADKVGYASYRLNDLHGKLSLQASANSQLNLKWSIYDETSNATYVGLTQPMYDQGGDDFVQIAPDDRLDIRRYALSLQHKYRLSENTRLTTTAYAYTTSRNWKRQDFTYNPNASGLTGKMFGDANQPEGAIYLINSTGNRNRQFEVMGIEPRLQSNIPLLGKSGTLDAGLRLHYEQAFEQRVNGANADALSGALVSDEQRSSLAYSAYTQYKWLFSSSLSLTAGLRIENLNYTRKIMRAAGKDTTILAMSDVNTLIPGIGINYNINENITLYSGIHRGFSPPRIKDAISNNGQDLHLEAEKSWNAELGTRFQSKHLKAELTLFSMDFSNQVIPVSESSGSAGTGFINGGKSMHRGIEAGLSYSFDMLMPDGFSLSLSANTTLLDARFSGDRFVAAKTDQVTGQIIYANIKNNKTPYAPALMANSWITFETPAGFGFQIHFTFTGKQYADVLNTENVAEFIALAAANPDFKYTQATANGRIGLLDAYQPVHLSAWFKPVKKPYSFHLSVKNIFNERYIISRRPQGIRLGLPFFAQAGFSYSF
jgi:Fe(3+) dicitrate transport protein